MEKNSMTSKEMPHSPACERNQGPIKKILRQYLKEGNLLEMGHGTGQHALYFASHFPKINWHASDQTDYHWMLRERLKQKPQENIVGPFTLEVGENAMKEQLDMAKHRDPFHYFFTANTLHIMNQKQVDIFCIEVSDCLRAKAELFLYGPFRFNNEFTSESNKEFHQTLLARGQGSAIKDFERIEAQLGDHGIDFIKRHDLPANNQLLVFRKR